MDARSMNDDAYLSDDEGLDSFTAAAQLSTTINQVKSVIEVLLSAFNTIKSEHDKITDESKKVTFLTQTLNAIGIENVQKTLTQAHMMLKIVEQNEEILECIEMPMESFTALKTQILELEALFNQLWKESMTASIKFLAKNVKDAKPEEVVKSGVGLFTVKKDAPVECAEVEEKKKTL